MDGVPLQPGFGDLGFPGWFVAFFVFVVVLGVGLTIWKVLESRKMAGEAGIDEDRAAAVTLLSEDGFEANYLASTLRSGNRLYDAPPDDGADVAGRLEKLEDLRRQGTITEDEYAAQRAEIIKSV